MKKVLFIDGCLRGELSRTKRLGAAFLKELPLDRFTVERVDLNALELLPLNREALEKRDALVDAGEYDNVMFEVARQIASADMIVVAAPFWDMGIPAKLKTYLEHASVAGLTFRVEANGDCVGCCKASALVYLSTRGMNIADGDEMEQATPYLRAVSKFFGIADFHTVSAWGLDMISEAEVEARVRAAAEEAAALAQSFTE